MPDAPRPRNNTARHAATIAPLAVALIAGNVITPTASPKKISPVPTTAVATRTTQALAPSPLLGLGKPADWWFVFKLNAGAGPGCAGQAQRQCIFGGTPGEYKFFSQQYAFASSVDSKLQAGGGCAGDTTTDPIGATFDQIYNGKLFYVVWNDQFYDDPMKSKGSPAGHSKGILAWNAVGDGVIMQVSTPSWPGSGNIAYPREGDGNTLGCIDDNNVKVSQHFFSLRLNKADVIAVLEGLANASVVTDPENRQIVNSGGPAEIQDLVEKLGANSKATDLRQFRLSTGVTLMSKPSKLNVPPWQMVSAALGGEPLRVATWWMNPAIPSTDGTTPVTCWDPKLGKPGAVDIAITGTWEGRQIGLKGISGPAGNHGKFGVSTGTHHYAIFGDLNQQGSLSGPKCDSSQNGRGGMFFVVENEGLATSVAGLIKGESAPK